MLSNANSLAIQYQTKNAMLLDQIADLREELALQKFETVTALLRLSNTHNQELRSKNQEHPLPFLFQDHPEPSPKTEEQSTQNKAPSPKSKEQSTQNKEPSLNNSSARVHLRVPDVPASQILIDRLINLHPTVFYARPDTNREFSTNHSESSTNHSEPTHHIPFLCYKLQDLHKVPGLIFEAQIDLYNGR